MPAGVWGHPPLASQRGPGWPTPPAPCRPGGLAPGQTLDSGPLLTSVSLWFAVIRAKAVSEKEVDSGNDIYGNPIKRIQYEIKQIKVSQPRQRPRLSCGASSAAEGLVPELSPATCGAGSKVVQLQAGLVLLNPCMPDSGAEVA